MLSCTEISFVISFFNFEKFGVKPRCFFLTHTVLHCFGTDNYLYINTSVCIIPSLGFEKENAAVL